VLIAPGYRSRGSGVDSLLYQILLVAVGLDRGLLRPVKINKELLEEKVVAPL
jgi:hypothetical protein